MDHRGRKQAGLQKAPFKKINRPEKFDSGSRTSKLFHGKGSNWSDFKKRTKDDLEATFGNAARFTEQDPDAEHPTEHYWQPFLPNAVGSPDDDGLEYEDDERSAARKSVFKEKAHMVEQRPKIFADIWKRLSDVSKDVVQRHEEWSVCNDQRCPAHLWQILAATHSIRADNNAPVVMKFHARNSYNSLKQFGGESLVAYRQRFESAYDSYLAAGNEKLEDETTAMDFFSGLDDQRHAEFKRVVKNLFVSEEKDPYDSVMSVFIHVDSYTPSRVTSNYTVSRNATVFHATGAKVGKRGVSSSSGPQVKTVRDLSKIKCYNCDEFGHYKNKCPKARVLCVTRVLSTTHGLLNKCSEVCIKWYEVVLDSGATISVMNAKLLNDIRECDEISIMGVTNEPMVLNMKGSLGGFIETYCSDNVTGNILSLSELQKKGYKVLFDSKKSCFKWYLDDGSCIVFEMRHGLYIADMSSMMCPVSNRVFAVMNDQASDLERDIGYDIGCRTDLGPSMSAVIFDVHVDPVGSVDGMVVVEPEPSDYSDLPPLISCDSSDDESEYGDGVEYGDVFDNDDDHDDDNMGVVVEYSTDTESEYDGDCSDCDDLDDGDMECFKITEKRNIKWMEYPVTVDQQLELPNWGFAGFTREGKKSDGWEPFVSEQPNVPWGCSNDDDLNIDDLQLGGSSRDRVVDPVEDAAECVNAFHAPNVSGVTCNYVLNTQETCELPRVLSTVYSPVQLRKAEEARDLLHRAGYPSYLELQKMVKSGNFTGSSVTAQDVAIASKVYGNQIASIRGKFTKKAVRSTPSDPTLLDEPSVQSVAVDLMYVGNQSFLIGLCSPLCLVLSSVMLNETTESLQQGMLDMFQVVASRGFVVNTVEMEPAAAMAKLPYNLGPGVSTDITGAGDHLPALDVRIRRMKEIVRSTVTHVNFMIPMSKIKYLVYYAVARINVRCTSGRSDGQSPYVAFTGRKPNWKREIGLVFGDLCECAVTGVVSNDGLVARTSSHVALCPTGNASGSWVFWSLSTNKLVRRSRYVLLKTWPTLIVDVANRLAESESSDPNFVLCEHDEIDDETDDMLDDGIFAHVVNPEDDIGRSYDRVGVSNEVGKKKGKRGRPRKVTIPPVSASSSCIPTDNVSCSTPIESELPVIDDVFDNYEVLVEPESSAVVNNGELTGDINAESMMEVDNSVEIEHGSDEIVLNLSIKKGKLEYGKIADESILGELEQIVVDDPPKLKPVLKCDQSEGDVKRAIMSFLFLKAKEDANGNFDKLKSRLVANGKQQDATLFPDKSSPTAKLDHIMVCLSLAAKFGMFCSVIDITGAYLEADWTNPVKQLVWLEKPVVDILVAKHPEYAKFVEPDGRMLTQAMKALYGCLESSRLWYDLLTSVLIKMGFIKSEIDPCVMIAHRDGRRVIVVIYVDDLLVLSYNARDAAWALGGLKGRFKRVKCKTGEKSFDYLGMRVTIENGSAILNMDGYEDSMLNLMPGVKDYKYPADENVFELNLDSVLLSRRESRVFHTIVAKLLYYSMRVKPEIQVAVSFLTTRVIAPTNDDLVKLVHVLGYVKRTRGRGRVLCIGDQCDGDDMNVSLRVYAHIDAAFGSHRDGKSHTGVVVRVGNSTVLSRSVKQKIVTRDSTEAEIVGCSDFVIEAISVTEFLRGLGFAASRPVIYQDNESAILMMTKGNGKDRTRHLRVRKYWVKEKFDDGELIVRYLKTNSMLGDLLSKAKVGKQFVVMRNAINGVVYED